MGDVAFNVLKDICIYGTYFSNNIQASRTLRSSSRRKKKSHRSFFFLVFIVEKWGAALGKTEDGWLAIYQWIRRRETAFRMRKRWHRKKKVNKNLGKNEWRRSHHHHRHHHHHHTVPHRVHGMSKRLESEVECVQSLIMADARKETSIGNRAPVFDCVHAFLSERSCILAAPPQLAAPSGVYIVSAHCRTRTHIFVVAAYKSSAFPLTSHYRTRTRAILACDHKTTESKKPLSGSDVAGINFISCFAVSTYGRMNWSAPA